MIAIVAWIYWTIYSLFPGWHRPYAQYMKKRILKPGRIRRQAKLCIKILKEADPKAKNVFYLAVKTLDFLLTRYFLGTLANTNYFYNQLYKYDWRMRNRFVTNDRTNFADRYLNEEAARVLCRDKTKAADYWKDWYKRNWLCREPGQVITEEILRKTFLPSGKCIVKPLTNHGGHGVFLLDPAREDFSGQLYFLNSQQVPYILESYIEQTGTLHCLNESSLNTIRLVTVRRQDGSIEPLASIVRIGHQGAVVDNASSGGVTFDVDLETGTVCHGTDYHGNYYTKHPDSGIQIEGIQIPRWNEVLEFAISAHRHAPKGLGIAGWDICVSENDIYLIEVNNCPAIATRRPEKMDLWRKLKEIFREKDANRHK